MRRNVAVFSDSSGTLKMGEYPSHLMGELVHGMTDQELLHHARTWLVMSGRLTSDEAAGLYLAVVEGG